MIVAYWLTFDERTADAEGAPFVDAQTYSLLIGLRDTAAAQGLIIDGLATVRLQREPEGARAARQAAADEYAADRGLPSWRVSPIATLLAEAPARPPRPGDEPGAPSGP